MHRSLHQALLDVNTPLPEGTRPNEVNENIIKHIALLDCCLLLLTRVFLNDEVSGREDWLRRRRSSEVVMAVAVQRTRSSVDT